MLSGTVTGNPLSALLEGSPYSAGFSSYGPAGAPPGLAAATGAAMPSGGLGSFASPSNIGSLIGTALGMATGVPGLGLVGSVAGGALGSASMTSGQGLSPSLGGALGVAIGNTALGHALGLGQSQADNDLSRAMDAIATNGFGPTVAATNAAMDANPNASLGSATNPAPAGIVAGDPEGLAAAASLSSGGDGIGGGGIGSGGPNGGGAGGGDAGATGGYAGGGRVTGPGGPRDDAVTTRTSAGEFVLNAAAADAIEAVLGKGALDHLNAIGNRDEAGHSKAQDEARALVDIMHRRRHTIVKLVPVDHDPFAL